MKDLLESMNYAYEFVSAARPLQVIKSRTAIIERLAQQTTECAYFISDYAAQRSFGESDCVLATHRSLITPSYPNGQARR